MLLVAAGRVRGSSSYGESGINRILECTGPSLLGARILGVLAGVVTPRAGVNFGVDVARGVGYPCENKLRRTSSGLSDDPLRDLLHLQVTPVS